MSLWLIGLGASVGYLIMKQERVQSTLDTHAPRVRASPATHMLSPCNKRLHVKSKDGVLVSLAIG